MLIPRLSCLEVLLCTLRAHPKGIPPDLLRTLSEVSLWLSANVESPPPHSLPPAMVSEAKDWHEQLTTAVQLQIRNLAILFKEFRILQRDIEGIQYSTRSVLEEAARHPTGKHSYHDHFLILLKSSIAGLGVLFSGIFWIFSGWENGSSPVIVAAVSCCFFANIREPRPVALSVLRWSTVCLLVSSFYLFLVVPHAQTFEELSVMLAVPYLAIGLFISQPGFNLIAMMLAVNTALLTNIQNVYGVNYVEIFNANLASAFAMIFAPLWAILIRPIGSTIASQRLMRASWIALSHVASQRPYSYGRLGPQMVDRLGQIVPSLATSKGKLASEGLRELQLGYCAISLQQAAAAMPPRAQRSLKRVLICIAQHFRMNLQAGHIVAPPHRLVLWINDALSHIRHLPGHLQRDSFIALVVLRASLIGRNTVREEEHQHDH